MLSAGLVQDIHLDWLIRMDGAAIQNKIYYGYGKAATKLGLSFDIYRSSDGDDPLKLANKIGSTLVSPTTNWAYSNYRKYDENVWNLITDGRVILVGDYLVGENTFFVAAKQHIMPIMGVMCDREISVRRPKLAGDKGYIGYSRYEAVSASTYDVILTDCPCSFLKGSRGDTNPVKLPTDARAPWYTMFLPKTAPFLKVGDIILDEYGQEFVLSTNELTELGWRLNIFGLES